MQQLKRGFLFPSAAFTIQPKQVRFYAPIAKAPSVGDVVSATDVGGSKVQKSSLSTLLQNPSRVQSAATGTLHSRKLGVSSLPHVTQPQSSAAATTIQLFSACFWHVVSW